MRVTAVCSFVEGLILISIYLCEHGEFSLAIVKRVFIEWSINLTFKMATNSTHLLHARTLIQGIYGQYDISEDPEKFRNENENVGGDDSG